MSRQVLRYTVVRQHPETDVATAILAGQRVPSWAKGLVDDDDLVDAAEVEEVEAAPAPSAPALQVPDDLEGEDVLDWISEPDGAADRVARGNAVYLKAAHEDADEDELEEVGRLILAAVYRIEDASDEDLEDAPETPDYEAMTIPALKAEIDKRNEDHAAEDQVVVEGAGNKPDLVAALVADDAAQSDSGN